MSPPAVTYVSAHFIIHVVEDCSPHGVSRMAPRCEDVVIDLSGSWHMACSWTFFVISQDGIACTLLVKFWFTALKQPHLALSCSLSSSVLRGLRHASSCALQLVCFPVSGSSSSAHPLPRVFDRLQRFSKSELRVESQLVCHPMTSSRSLLISGHVSSRIDGGCRCVRMSSVNDCPCLALACLPSCVPFLVSFPIILLSNAHTAPFHSCFHATHNRLTLHHAVTSARRLYSQSVSFKLTS